MHTLFNGMPFVNDPEAIGKWEFVALTQSIDEYDGKESAYDEDKAFREVYFMPEGKNYWIFEGWTKGVMLFWGGGSEFDYAQRSYEIRDINGKRRMFMQSYEHPDWYIVLKKTSDIAISSDKEIGRRDNIDLPFVSDESVLGGWLPVDFVTKPEDFDPNRKWDYLGLMDMSFHADGTVVRHYHDATGEIEWNDRWTKGFLLDKKHGTASHYELKKIDEVEYLFMEWKMNNYVFNYSEPDYYVFKRK